MEDHPLYPITYYHSGAILLNIQSTQSTYTHDQPPSHSVQLGCAGGLWNLKEEIASVSLYCRKESSRNANISSFKRDLQHSEHRR